MLLTGKIPLVGITSSHIWLHQGPLWTYMLAVALWISHFNPVSGSYLTAAMGVLTVWFVYKFSSEMFSQKVGLLASSLYATSPFTIYFARMAYHTAPIAILTLLLFYFHNKWINGYRYAFPIIMLLFALLYNFETATFMLVPVFLIVLFYGIVEKTKWVRNILNKKILLLSLFGLLIPMIPMILYDIHHGYPQTLKFAEWIIYKAATVFGFPKLHPNAPGESYQSMLPFASNIIQYMIFLKSGIISWLILCVSCINLILINLKYVKKRKFLQSYSLLFLFFIIPALAYIAEKTNSDAYWIVFFPTFAIMLALVFNRLMKYKRLFFPAIILFLLYIALNVVALFQSNFLLIKGVYGYTLFQRETVAKQIVHESVGKEYTIDSTGPGSQYESITMNYQYLTWWLGHGPSKNKQKLRFTIEETLQGIMLTKTDKHNKKIEKFYD